MRPPTAWLISRNDGQAEKYIQLELPEVNPDIYTATPLYSHPTAMYSTSLEAVECRFDIDKLVGNLVLWADLTIQEKNFLYIRNDTMLSQLIG